MVYFLNSLVLRRSCLMLFACFIFGNLIKGQIDLGPAPLTKGKIYALVIGISNYDDVNIKDLSFAHKDAMAFASYLTSKSGGSVSNENIKVLTNEQATISNVYAAKREIENKIQSGDLFYFYFSGHGDVEGGLYKLGFLLCYDTPFKNYYTNAVRIEDINMMANTLSIEKDAKVVVITDACHSGKLVGSDNRGTMLASEQLQKAEKNEVRLASCEADQLSQEGTAWGGGRGVFSYYLINGMLGQADADDKDGIVTIMELEAFVKNKVTKDVAKLKQTDQFPVVKGKQMAPIAIINEEEFLAMKDIVKLNDSDLLTAKSIQYSFPPSGKYFINLSKYKLLDLVKFNTWKDLKDDALIDLALDKFSFCEDKEIKNSKWKKALLNNQKIRSQYSQNLASNFHNNAQQLLNPFMSGRVIKITNKDSTMQTCAKLDNCVDILHTALNLIDEKSELYNIIAVKEHFTRGLSARLKIPYSTNPDSLVTIALKEQKMANQIDKRVGYVKSEMSYEYISTATTPGKTSKKKIIDKKKKANTTTEKQ